MEHGEQVHLLLSAPGQPPATLPGSSWRGWLPSPRGPIDPTTAASGVRLSPVSPRVERALVAAVAADDVDSLARMTTQPGPAQDPARVLTALRLAALDGASAIDLLLHVAAAPTEPTDSKLLRKHWGDLAVQVHLAPSVPALLTVSRSSLGLLAAELLVDAGRIGEALTLLETFPPRSTVVLAKAAALLAGGDHGRVLEVTASLPNSDDVSALALVARSVAARSQQDLTAALDAVCEALSDAARNPAVIAAALEERSHLYSLAGATVAAHADLEALAAMTGGQLDVTVPPPSSLRRTDDPDEDDTLDRARNRIRRRITGVGAPGTFGGRHYSTYRDEIATMFALGQVDAVEELLLGLLDVVEDEVDELRVPLDPTYFLTLADLYQDSGRTDDLHALRERYAAAEARATRRAADPVDGDLDPGVAGVDLAKPVSGRAPEPSTADVAEPAAVGGGEARPAVGPDLASVLRPAPADASTLGEGPSPEPGVAEQPANEAAEAAAAEEAPEPDDPGEPEGRTLTPVERAIRGPRVRSL